MAPASDIPASEIRELNKMNERERVEKANRRVQSTNRDVKISLNDPRENVTTRPEGPTYA